MKVIILNDDSKVSETIEEVLEFEAMESVTLQAANTVFDVLGGFKADVILLGQRLADQTGEDALRRLRASNAGHADIPVIFMADEASEDTMVQMLDLGADDCISAPISPRVLIRKIRVLVRRVRAQSKPRHFLKRCQLIIDASGKNAFINGQSLGLTQTEFKILSELALDDENQVVLKKELLSRIFGDASAAYRTLDVHMCALRKKLKAHGFTVESIRAVGYRLKPVETQAAMAGVGAALDTASL